MTDDAPWLAAFAADPADRGRRLVYADWLDDRGDPRGELVRACEGMRRVPVYSDGYWRLKARRNELRPHCPTAWLAATGYDGTDYDPVFRDGWPDGWRERWRVIREFTERWHGLPMPDVGGRADVVAAEEARVGLTLPPSVREYVAYAHDVFPDPAERVVHRDPYSLYRTVGVPAVALMTISEGGLTWAVRTADLGRPDPPVFACYPSGMEDDDTLSAGEAPESDTVTGFVVGFTVAYKDDAGQFTATVRGTDRLRDLLAAAFPVRYRVAGEVESYESEAGVLATLFRSAHGPSVELEVCVHRRLGWEAVPDFVWEYARRAHTRGGMFLSPDDVAAGLRHWGEGPVPGWVPREAVPPMRQPRTPEPGPGGWDGVPF